MIIAERNNMVSQHFFSKNKIVKFILVVSAIVFVLIAVNRATLIINSNQVAAVIIDCDSKWVEVTESGSRSKTRRQVQYYPVAETNNGQKVHGDVMAPNKTLCSQMIGNQVTVLLHNSDASKNGIYSFIQFWSLPLLAMAFCLLIICSFISRVLVQSIALLFTLGYVAYGSHELGFWGDVTSLVPYNSPQNSALTDQNKSQADQKSKTKLERCLWASMRKEKVDNRWQLKRLICQDENITDLSSIGDLSNLEELYLQNNMLQNLESMGPLLQLRKISVAGNKHFVSSKGIEKAINLEEFQANKTSLSDLTGMEQLAKLKVFAAMQSKITDISVLTQLTKLEHLTLSYNQIEDISALGNKPALKELTIYNNPIRDISSLFTNEQITLFGFNSKAFTQCEQITQLKAHIAPQAKVYFPDSCR